MDKKDNKIDEISSGSDEKEEENINFEITKYETEIENGGDKTYIVLF
jgi:hypothetical protein